MDNTPLMDNLPPERLAALFSAASTSPWREKDLRALIHLQFQAPLRAELLATSDDPQVQRMLGSTSPLGERTLEEALTEESTDLCLLHAIKDLARHIQGRPDHPAHGTCATLIYYTAVAALLLRMHRVASALSPEQVRWGFDWAKTCPIPESVQSLLTRAEGFLSASSC